MLDLQFQGQTLMVFKWFFWNYSVAVEFSNVILACICRLLMSTMDATLSKLSQIVNDLDLILKVKRLKFHCFFCAIILRWFETEPKSFGKHVKVYRKS